MNTALAHSLHHRADNQRRIADVAAQLWSESPPPAAHAWLTAKGVGAHDIRQRNGRLVVPMRDVNGIIWNLQFIGPGGSTRYLHGGRVFGLFHRIGAAVRGVADVAEDYATAARVHEQTGRPVHVAFQLNNLRPVALVLRSLDSAARFTIWLPKPPPGCFGNYRGAQSAAEAAAAAVSGSVAMVRGEA